MDKKSSQQKKPDPRIDHDDEVAIIPALTKGDPGTHAVAVQEIQEGMRTQTQKRDIPEREEAQRSNRGRKPRNSMRRKPHCARQAEGEHEKPSHTVRDTAVEI